MTLRFLCALILAATFGLAREPVFPSSMSQLQMLIGQWSVSGRQGWIEFHFDSEVPVMVGREKPNTMAGKWQRFMLMYTEGKAGKVQAEFFDPTDHVIHYHLAYADGTTLRFVDDPATGAPQHQLTYEKEGPNRLLYRFETDRRTTDSGVLARTTELRPLGITPAPARPLPE